jgi:hypothetical protein
MSKADGGPLSRSGGRSGATAPARWSSGGASLFGLASPKARPGSTSERGIRWSSPRAPASGVETLRRSSRVETRSAFLVRTTTAGGSMGDRRKTRCTGTMASNPAVRADIFRKIRRRSRHERAIRSFHAQRGTRSTGSTPREQPDRPGGRRGCVGGPLPTGGTEAGATALARPTSGGALHFGEHAPAGQPVFTAWTSSIVPALRRRLSTISKPAASTSGSERRV